MRIFLALFLSMSVFQGFGQKGSLDVSIFGYVQRTFIHNKLDLENPAYNKLPTYRPAFELMVRNGLSNRIKVGYGGLASLHDQEWRYTILGSDKPGKTKLVYVKLPVTLYYSFVKRKNISIYLCTGPQLSILISADGALPVITDLINAGGAFRDITLDGMAGAGLERRLADNFFVHLKLRTDYSFTNTENRSARYGSVPGAPNYLIWDAYKTPRPSGHNITMGIAVGITALIR